eukprot:TRINITY_DN3978_c0_g2_i1.p1 TRINITY_DN3978_c0_g2~~TRINITY_DN3978_c0_g2_i1.p1  ORF type:complete len:192 (-),score=34.27 TRINITY_DN3978_c0_g2_i1:10-585(-)
MNSGYPFLQGNRQSGLNTSVKTPDYDSDVSDSSTESEQESFQSFSQTGRSFSNLDQRKLDIRKGDFKVIFMRLIGREALNRLAENYEGEVRIEGRFPDLSVILRAPTSQIISLEVAVKDVYDKIWVKESKLKLSSHQMRRTRIIKEYLDQNKLLVWRKEGRPRNKDEVRNCLLYTSPSPRDRQKSRMPSSA